MCSNADSTRKRAKRDVNVNLALATWWANNPYKGGLYPGENKKEWMHRMVSDTGVVLKNVDTMYAKIKFLEAKYRRTKQWLEETGAEALQMHGKDFIEDAVSRMCPWYYILDRVLGFKQEYNRPDINLFNLNNGEEIIVEPSSRVANANFESDDEDAGDSEVLTDNSNDSPQQTATQATSSMLHNGNFEQNYSVLSKKIAGDSGEHAVSNGEQLVRIEKLKLQKTKIKLKWKREKFAMQHENKIQILEKQFELEAKMMKERCNLENEKLLLIKKNEEELTQFRIKELELKIQLKKCETQLHII